MSTKPTPETPPFLGAYLERYMDDKRHVAMKPFASMFQLTEPGKPPKATGWRHFRTFNNIQSAIQSASDLRRVYTFPLTTFSGREYDWHFAYAVVAKTPKELCRAYSGQD